MAIDNVKTAVLKRVREKAATALKEAEQEAKKIEDASHSQIAELKTVLQEDKEKYKIHTEAKNKFSTELDNKKKMLTLQKKLIDEVFDEAVQHIKKLNKEQHKKYLEELKKKAEKQLNVANIYCRKEDIALLKDAEEKQMIGGLIAENKEKTERIDYRYEVIIKELQKKIEGGVINILLEK